MDSSIALTGWCSVFIKRCSARESVCYFHPQVIRLYNLNIVRLRENPPTQSPCVRQCRCQKEAVILGFQFLIFA